MNHASPGRTASIYGPRVGVLFLSILSILSILVGLNSSRAVDFVRGDANADGAFDVSDAVAILGSLDFVMGECDR